MTRHNDALLATCWTTAGDTGPHRDEPASPLPLRERIEAASAAGFRGFGLLHGDLVAAGERYGLPAVRSMLQDNGIDHLELEFLTDWWAEGPRRQASDTVRRTLLTAAETLGARHLKIGPDVTDAPWDADNWAREFAQLCSEAEDAGTRVGLEFLPWSNIKTVHDGLHLVQQAEHPAGGLIVDVWHTERAATPPADLATLPPERIVGVELSDAGPQIEGTLFEDTAHRRLLCGHGSFDLQGIIRALRTAGFTGPWGVEILSAEHRALPVSEAADAAFRTAAEQLASA